MVGSTSGHQGTAEEYFQSCFMPGTSPGESMGPAEGDPVAKHRATGQAFPASGSLVIQLTHASTLHEYASAALSRLHTPNTACVDGLGNLVMIKKPKGTEKTPTLNQIPC